MNKKFFNVLIIFTFLLIVLSCINLVSADELADSSMMDENSQEQILFAENNEAQGDFHSDSLHDVDKSASNELSIINPDLESQNAKMQGESRDMDLVVQDDENLQISGDSAISQHEDMHENFDLNGLLSVNKQNESILKDDSPSNVWYVGANTSENGDGSFENPFNNIKIALDFMEDGDTLYIREGVYSGLDNTNLTINQNGIVIQSYPGEAVKLYADMNNTRVFLLNGSNIVLKDLTFTNNYTESGGSLRWQGANGSLINCTIDNSSGRVGGAIIWSGANGLIANSTITNTNHSNSAVSFSSKNGKIVNSTFTDNHGNYGTIMFSSESVLDNCTFINNTASESYGGAGIYVYISTVTVNNSRFINNTGGKLGGAIAQNGGNLILLNTEIVNNTGVLGGGIESKKGNLTIDNATFINNTAELGGAIYLLNPNVTIGNSQFYNNGAETGGAIYCLSNNTVLNNSILKNNTANTSYGGAIYWTGANGTVENSIIQYNSAKEAAGGILYYENITISNSTVNHNYPSKDEVLDITEIQTIVYTTESGYSNVTMSNGYLAYCIDKDMETPSRGSPYNIDNDMSHVINKITGENVANYLKIFFVKYYENISKKNAQNIIWTFTNGYYRNSTDPIVNAILNDSENGLSIPDKRYSVRINDTHVKVYNFESYISSDDVKQKLFGFNVTEEEIRHELTIIKESLNKTVMLGNQTSFLIIVKNTGNDQLSNVLVIEDSYDGLVYDGFVDNTNLWIKGVDSQGKHFWAYNDTLKSGFSANFTVIFNTTRTGNFTNVIVGDSNETNETTVNNTTSVYAPNMTIEKISNNKTAEVGEIVSFTIILKNTGDCNLTGVYIRDNEYSNGLAYHGFIDRENKWSFDGIDTWRYDGVLAPSESISLELLFLATTKGLKTNTAIAGHNLTNETVNSTNKTNVIENSTHKNSTDDNGTDDNKTSIPEKNNPISKTITDKNVSCNIKAGNPLILLIISLFTLVFYSFKGKK